MGLKILILEDSQLDAELMIRELRRGELAFESVIVSQKEEYEQKLRAWKPNLIISDFNLVGYTGKEALHYSKSLYPEIPFIAVSGSITKQMEIELLKNRANDVLKKRSIERLPFSVKRALNEREDRDELNRKNAELEKLIKEKEVLVQEVHHRVKNNLALFSGFLELDRMLHTSPEVDQVLDRNILRVKSIAVIHELVYETSSFSRISATRSVSKIFQFYIDPSHLSIEYGEMLTGNDFTCSINQVIPLGLLINEMMNIGFDYKGDVSDSVKVMYQKENKMCRIRVQSDHFCSTLLKHKEEHGTLGDVLIALLTQIPGELSLNSSDSTVQISFNQE